MTPPMTPARFKIPSFAVLLLLAGLSASLPLPAQNAHVDSRVDSRVESKMNAGLQALQQGRTPDAVQDFTQVTRLAPSLAEGHMNLGIALMRAGRLEESVSSLKTALQLKPTLSGPNLFLGILYFEVHQYDKAQESVANELKLNPDNPEALMLAGTIALAMDEPEKAIPPLDHASQLSPKDLELLDMLGRAHMLVAKKAYARMFELAPNSWQVHRVRARLYAEDGLHKEAIAEYKAAIQIEPNQRDLYEDLGVEYHKSSQLDLAEQTYAAELKLDPSDVGAMFNLASIRVERGNSAEAIPMLEEVVKADPTRTDAYYFLGRALASAGRDADAMAAFERVANPQSSGEMVEQSYYNLARLYRKAQRPQDAQKALAAYQKLKEAREKQGAQTVEKFRETK
ncbi:MAG TPA: tetratricopeptide repeat protein [Acidisarcina sp.]|nr:tetratricopeptide repeat protein [Acidisarcina sp.]